MDAQNAAGLIYANGVGIAADDEKAARYFKNAVPPFPYRLFTEYWAE
ncbi:SEL1-like repeat protein [Salmonella enterica subsp. enterica]|nr:SEL1-like repeat protein [Salmonella enterica subsp. enterica]